MIILHNPEDANSRAFVATYGDTAGVTVLNWYDEAARAQWIAAGGTLGVSAFPSVLIRRDTHTTTTDEGTFEVPAGWDVLRTPSEIAPLPSEGEPVARGLYTHDGAFLICRQSHTRMHFEPSKTPALFSTWRPDSADMVWIPNEPVNLNDERIHAGQRYICLQGHTTQADWMPPNVPALWAIVEDAPEVGEWVQPSGGHDAYQTGDRVTFNGLVYESTINANVWSPNVFGWIEVAA